MGFYLPNLTLPLKGDATNVNFYRSINLLTQFLASQLECTALYTISSKATKISQFMRLSPHIFSGTKVEKDPQGFIDEIENIFIIMHALEIEDVELTSYQFEIYSITVVQKVGVI